MNKKQDYTKFYISMIIILCVFFLSTTIYDKYEMHKHLQEDLIFANATGEFIIYEAEIINYCANISNISSNDLIMKFTQHKANEIISDAFEVEDE